MIFFLSLFGAGGSVLANNHEKGRSISVKTAPRTINMRCALLPSLLTSNAINMPIRRRVNTNGQGTKKCPVLDLTSEPAATHC